MPLKLELQKTMEAQPERGWVPAEFYHMVADGAVVGTIQLRLGNSEDLRLYGGQVGYSVVPEHRGHGHAGAALRLLVPIARQHGMAELWITCTPDNMASRRTLEKVGAVYVETVRVPLDSDLHARGDYEMRRYRLDLPIGARCQD